MHAVVGIICGSSSVCCSFISIRDLPFARHLSQNSSVVPIHRLSLAPRRHLQAFAHSRPVAHDRRLRYLRLVYPPCSLHHPYHPHSAVLWGTARGTTNCNARKAAIDAFRDSRFQCPRAIRHSQRRGRGSEADVDRSAVFPSAPSCLEPCHTIG